MSLEKIERIHSHEKFEDIDALFIVKPQNVIYILGFKVESDVFIMIPREDLKETDGKIWIFLNALEYDQVKDIVSNNKTMSEMFKLWLLPSGEPKFIPNTINNLKLKSVGFEEEFISVKRYEEWKNKFSNPNFIGISEIINHARLVKTEKEIQTMREAAKLGDIGFKAIYDTIEEGKTEKELAAEAEYAMRKAGSDGTSFDMIVASGEKSAYPHAMTSDKKVQDGDIIIVDIGARYNGYCSDMTRSFIFGKESKNKGDLINLVNDGEQYALDNIKVGLNCRDLDKLTRDFFMEKKEEWGSRFLHSLGHGVGIDIHESPYLSPISQDILEENMVLTIEPGLYIEGLGGARTEDQIVIKKNNYISLTESKKFSY